MHCRSSAKLEFLCRFMENWGYINQRILPSLPSAESANGLETPSNARFRSEKSGNYQAALGTCLFEFIPGKLVVGVVYNAAIWICNFLKRHTLRVDVHDEKNPH